MIQFPHKLTREKFGIPFAQGIGVGISKQMEAVNAIDEKELANLVETARSTVRASMQDPFGGARPEIIGGYAYGFGGNTTTYSNTYTFNSPKALDYREMRQELRRMDQPQPADVPGLRAPMADPYAGAHFLRTKAQEHTFNLSIQTYL